MLCLGRVVVAVCSEIVKESSSGPQILCFLPLCVVILKADKLPYLSLVWSLLGPYSHTKSEVPEPQHIFLVMRNLELCEFCTCCHLVHLSFDVASMRKVSTKKSCVCEYQTSVVWLKKTGTFSSSICDYLKVVGLRFRRPSFCPDVATSQAQVQQMSVCVCVNV